MNNDTTIEELIDLVISRLNLHEIAHYRERGNLRPLWVKIMRDNLIFNLGLLRRLSPHKLERLGLPLLLEEEFVKIVTSARIEDPLFNLHKVFTASGDSEHASAQNHIQDRNTRFALQLTEKQKELIRQSWHKILSMKDTRGNPGDGLKRFARNFYPLFFQLNPTGQRLFEASDLEEQSRALTNMLTWMMNNLDNMEQLVPVLAQMGGRHEIYGVESSDYKTFAQAIGETFSKILQNEITKECVEAWENALIQISSLMTEAGKKVKLGFRGDLLREKRNGDWKKCWATLTLDTLYIFNDEAFTELKGQYSIRGVDRITFPQTTATNCFELVSTNPPFYIRLSSDSVSTFQDWIFEIDWRIQAIQRVFASTDLSGSDEDSEISVEGRHKGISARAKQTNKKINHKKRIRQSASRFSKGEIALLGDVTPEQKELIRASWKAVHETGSNKFFTEFYKRFFEVNPSGKRLFEEQSMEIQFSALNRMIFMIVQALDNSDRLKEKMDMLGGRHEIYGVSGSDYIAFTNALCDTMEIVLAKSFTPPVRDAWYKVMMDMASFMQNAGKRVRSEHLKTVMYRRVKKDGEWRLSMITANLEAVYIYQDDKMQKLRTTIPYNEITDIQYLDQNSMNSAPYPFGFALEISTRDSQVNFCCKTQEQQLLWVHELNWRIQAVHRIWKEGEDTTESTDIKTGRKAGKIKKKAETKKSRSLQKIT